MSGFVSLTAWRKPAIQLSTGGILIPPTVGHGVRLRHTGRDDAGQIPRLLGRELEAERVRDGARGLALAAAVRLRPVELIDSGEVDVGRLRCDLGHGRLDQEADRDHEVVPVVDCRRQVRQVVVSGLRRVHPALDAELGLGPLEAVDRELVEAAVVETTRVGDQPDRDRLGRGLFARVAARRRRRLACLVVVAAAAGSRDREDERYEQQHRPRQPSHHLHGTSLVAHRIESPDATALGDPIARTDGLGCG